MVIMKRLSSISKGHWGNIGHFTLIKKVKNLKINLHKIDKKNFIEQKP